MERCCRARVASGVHHVDGVRRLCIAAQRLRQCEGPLRAVHHGSAQQVRTFIDLHGSARLERLAQRAKQRRCAVVGGCSRCELTLLRSHIVHVEDRAGDLRRNGVHREVECVARHADVASSVLLRCGDRMCTFSQCGGRSQRPLAVGAHHGGTQHDAIVVHGDLGTHLTRAGDDWLDIVGEAAVGDRTHNASDVVPGVGHVELRRSSDVHLQQELSRRSAHLACGIRRCGHEAVEAFGQFVRFWNAPLAGGIGLRFAHEHPVA
ncbi:hypothetical protein SDC9_159498 [bioreactor metagenome]|uniref:Uncharacterized protein n=1 Tax=bioreactor metagenome TaxID=1076179 RepID=A0A645FF15_9ZZZZ